MEILRQHILKKNIVIHSSLIPDLNELNSPLKNNVFASDNVTATFRYPLLKKFELGTFLILSYKFFNKTIVFVSVLDSLENEIVNCKITCYICDKSLFHSFKKVKSTVSRVTFGILKSNGKIYFSNKKITPLKSYVFTLKSEFNYALHSKNDSKLKILIKAVFQRFKGRSCLTIY